MGNHCLYCHEEMSQQVNWASFFTVSEESYLCSACQEQLQEIIGETCQTCSRPFDNLDAQYIVGERCYDCVRWEEDAEWSGYLQKNDSIYLYNDFLKEVLSQYKFRGDYILAKIFAQKIQEKLKDIDYDLLVPIPLSKERLFERGFNQSEAFIREAGLIATNLLHRTHSEKQSKKSRKDRIHLPQVFRIQEDVQHKNIVLIDDIYTTGSTLRHAAKLLKSRGAKSVSSLTLARG